MSSPAPQLEKITVRPVRTVADFNSALDVRHQGYKKYGFDRASIEDEYDLQPNATILLASIVQASEDGREHPVGTLRLLDARNGSVELERFVSNIGPLSGLNRDFAEATRFSVIACSERPSIKLALWKAFHRYCLGLQRNHMVVWIRRGARRDYEHLMFSPVPGLAFRHHKLGGHLHETYAINLVDLEERYRSANHPLHQMIFQKSHPSINPFA